MEAAWRGGLTSAGLWWFTIGQHHAEVWVKRGMNWHTPSRNNFRFVMRYCVHSKLARPFTQKVSVSEQLGGRKDKDDIRTSRIQDPFLLNLQNPVCVQFLLAICHLFGQTYI